MLTICIAGKNEIAINGIEFVLSRGLQNVNLVYIGNKDDTGVDSWQPSFKAFCKVRGIPAVSINELYKIDDLLFISLEYDKIVKPENFASRQLYNIHFSFLPEYKGMFTSVFPLMHGKEYAGVTLHKIDKGIDTGEIIDQLKFPLSFEINARGLYQLYLNNAKVLFEKNMPNLLTNRITSEPQSSINASYFSKKSIDFSNIKIDFNKTAFEIHNQIRAFCFRDYQLPEVNGRKVFRSQITNTKSVGKPGVVLCQDMYSSIIHSIDYDVEVYFDQLDDLLEACKIGDIETISLLQHSSYDISTKNKNGWDCLIVSCYYGKIEVVKYLLSLGFDANSRNYKGTSAIMYAKYGVKDPIRFQIIDLLITAGADLLLKDNALLTALDYAKAEKDLEAVEFFSQKLRG